VSVGQRPALTSASAPLCAACVGDRTNPDGGPCLRCRGTGVDPDPLARLDGHLGALGAALAVWATRDDSKAQPEGTRAGHVAVEAIDAMLAELRRARQQLGTEIRQAQDAAAARVDAMLARRRDGGFGNELWACLGCGGQMAGRRPASDLCRYCAPGGAR
jgi:hypothetical protein